VTDSVSLRDYFEMRLKEQQRAVEAALASAEKAVTKAEVATEKRFEGVNEFRATLADQAATLMPRAEAEIRFASLLAKIDSLQRVASMALGIAAVLPLVIGVIVTLLVR